MLFQDILNEKTRVVRPDFDKLFDLIIKNQTHPSDALLTRVNGFYNPEVHTWNNIPEKISPYVIGPNSEGLSDQLHYKFILYYGTLLISKGFSAFLQALQ